MNKWGLLKYRKLREDEKIIVLNGLDAYIPNLYTLRSIKRIDEIDDPLSKIYYLKEVEFKSHLIQEVLGTKISNAMGLPTVNNIPIYSFLDYKLLSSYFRKNDYIYHYIDDFLPRVNDIYGLYNNLLINPQYIDLFLQLIKMIIRDYFSCETDRHTDNFYIEEKDGKYSLAPLFDYSLSYNENDLKQKRNINYFNFNVEELKEYIKLFPEIRDYINLVLRINIDDLLNEIIRLYKIPIEDEEREVILRLSNERKNNLIKYS